MSKKIIPLGVLLGILILVSGFIIYTLLHHTDIHNTISNEKETPMVGTDLELTITINQQTYNAHLEDNETTQAFLKLLPQTFAMQELNGNEKYTYLNTPLPANPLQPDQIQAGNIMLYGDDCLVIFYKTFSTSYHYTKIGHIENLPNLNNQDVQVTINISE